MQVLRDMGSLERYIQIRLSSLYLAEVPCQDWVWGEAGCLKDGEGKKEKEEASKILKIQPSPCKT